MYSLRSIAMVTDIEQFLYLNCSRSFRDRFEKDLLQLYYVILEKTVKSGAESNNVEIPTIERIFEEYSDHTFFGAIIATLYLPAILVDSKTMKEVTSDPSYFKNFVLGDRLNFTIDYMNKNADYKSKIEVAVTELTEMSEL